MAIDEIGVGLRVLAVDDDPTCLALLEGLLKKCKYNVTSTNQATTALKLLREGRSKFDIMISDVSMPDMDGFKLLKLVGIEMDIPVVMLSQYGDKELVYEGVMHGAVDYLVKPVRLDMVQNIWQHVVRRTKLSQESPKGQGSSTSASTEQAKSGVRQRKEQEEDDKEGFEEITNEEGESGTPKKPRVVWSVELHRKFVAAVDYLGSDKAVPKKILDLMSVEGLTRENVASHLQKYRSYLKRIKAGLVQEGNMMSAFLVGESSISMKELSVRGLANPGLIPSYPQTFEMKKMGSLQPVYGINNNMMSTTSSDFGDLGNVEGYFGGQSAMGRSSFGSLDDIVNAMVKNATERRNNKEGGTCTFGFY